MLNQPVFDAYGLRWSVPEPTQVPAAADVQVRIHAFAYPGAADPAWQVGPLFSTRPWDQGETPVLVLAQHGEDGRVRLQYRDDACFEIAADGRSVAAWSSRGRPHLLPYLLGAVAAWVLRLRGVVTLHGSSIAGQGAALLFCGPSGIGKSTLAARLLRGGCQLVADDVCALQFDATGVQVQPGYARLRLWPDALAAIGRAVDDLPRVHGDHEKRVLQAAAEGFAVAQQAVRIAAVCLLVRSPSAALQARRLAPSEAVPRLVEQSYLAFLRGPLQQSHRRAEFVEFSQLAQRTAVVELAVPRGLDKLPQTLETVSKLIADA